MNRHHLLHVYTGLRAEIERIALSGRPAGAEGASVAGAAVDRREIICDLSRLLWDPNADDDLFDPDLH